MFAGLAEGDVGHFSGIEKLETIFRHKVFRMLVASRKISRQMIAMLSTWRYSGFHVFFGNRIQPKEDKEMENLTRYIIRASFSKERMQYLADDGTVSGTYPREEISRAFADH